MGKPIVSFTRIQAFKRACRLPYWLRYVEGAQETNEPDAFRNGRLWQETVYDRLRTGKARESDPGGIKDLIGYLNNGWWVSGLEDRVEYDVGPAIVEGYLDILLETDNSILILDIKGGWYPDLTKDRLYQLMTYAIPFATKAPHLDIGILARQGIHVKTVTVEELDEHLEQLREDIRKMLAWEEVAKSKGKPPRPSPSDACAYCTYIKACPVGEDFDPKNLTELARWYIKTKEEIALAAKILKGWIRANGPMNLGNQRLLALKESQRSSVSEEALWEILRGELDFIDDDDFQAIAETIRKVMTPDKRKIMKLAKYESDTWANVLSFDVVHDKLEVIEAKSDEG